MHLSITPVILRPLRAAACAAVLLSGCAGPDASPAASDALGATDLVWMLGRSIETNDMTTGVDVSLVRGDGRVAWSTRLAVVPDLPGGGIAFLSGPRAGRLAYGLVGEDGTVVVRADAQTGAAAEIATLDRMVQAAALSPDGTILYLVIDAADPEIHRLPLEPGAGLEHVTPVPAAPGFVITPFRGLQFTPDGEHLLLERCDAAGRCTWLDHALQSGETREIDAHGAGRLIDLSNDLLLTIAAECAAGPCPYLIVDRDSGHGIPWDPGAHNARLVVTLDGASVLAYDTAGTGGAAFRIGLADPITREARPLDPIRGLGAELGLAREGQDDWAPPGWLVLAPPGTNLGEQGGPVLVNVLDGRVVRLPAPEPG